MEMYARGLSMRDIEAAFTDEAGRCALSRTAASAVCERLWGEYQAFAQRDLGELDIVYLFIDGVAERLHLGQPREAVLAAWGIDSHGAKQVKSHLCCEFASGMRSSAATRAAARTRCVDALEVFRSA